MKEWYWFVILAVIIGTVFLPLILKEKCPGCKKNKLRSVDMNEDLRLEVEGESRQFLSFFTCDNCAKRWKRERSGPIEAADAETYEKVFASCVRESA